MIAVHVEHTLSCDARRQRRNSGEDSGLRHDCFLSRYESIFSGWMFQENLCGCDECLRAREAGEVERKMFGQRSSERRCTCFAGHQIHPAMDADTLRTRIRRVLERSLKKAPASRFAEGLGTDSSPPSSPPTSRERHHCRLGYVTGIMFPAIVAIFSRMAPGRFVSMRAPVDRACSYWHRRGKRVAENRETRVERCQMVSAEMQKFLFCDEHQWRGVAGIRILEQIRRRYVRR